jgi:hypothetical protein
MIGLSQVGTCPNREQSSLIDHNEAESRAEYYRDKAFSVEIGTWIKLQTKLKSQGETENLP